MNTLALEIHVDVFGKVQLSTNMGTYGHRIYGTKFQGNSKLVKSIELTESDCDALSELIRKTRRKLRQAKK